MIKTGEMNKTRGDQKIHTIQYYYTGQKKPLTHFLTRSPRAMQNDDGRLRTPKKNRRSSTQVKGKNTLEGNWQRKSRLPFGQQGFENPYWDPANSWASPPPTPSTLNFHLSSPPLVSRILRRAISGVPGDELAISLTLGVTWGRVKRVCEGFCCDKRTEENLKKNAPLICDQLVSNPDNCTQITTRIHLEILLKEGSMKYRD